MAAVIIGLVLLMQINQTLPDATAIKEIELKVPLRVYSADGLLIAEFGEERRKPVTIDETPQTLIDAILASEDDSFYQHRGIDIKGLIRAALSNFRSGYTQQGASTITMQVARNFFLTREKTYTRKLREVLLSIRLEQLLDKDEILALYINKVFLGHRAYGFGAAAEVYYGKELIELSLAEIAMLAGLPKAPSSNNPISNPKRAIVRRNYVLKRLVDLKKINKEQYSVAIEVPVTASKHGKTIELQAPHIAEMVRDHVFQQLGEQAYWAGLNVVTTVVAEKQLAAEKALRGGLQRYDRQHGYRGAVAHFSLAEIDIPDYPKLLSTFPNSKEQIPLLITDANNTSAVGINRDGQQIKLNIEDAKWARRFLTVNSKGERPVSMAKLVSPGDVVYIKPGQLESEEKTPRWVLSQLPTLTGSVIAINPETGWIEALVGGYDFFLNKYNRATQAIRQPGSTVKPFLYSASLDKGFTAASMISGAPIVEKDPVHGTIWRPENYSGKFYGPTRMRDALSKSMNLVSIRLLRSIGVPYTMDYLSRFGIDRSRFSASLTLALGAGGMTPLEMVTAYAALANGGYLIKPTVIDTISDRDGNVIFQSKLPAFCDLCYQHYLQPVSQQDAQEVTEVGTLPETTEEAFPFNGFHEITSLDFSYDAPRIMSPENNFLTTSMLKDVINQGTAKRALSLNRQDLAGKTGTTNDYVDAWFSGFNSKQAVTAWVGFDDPSSMGKGASGSSVALPIWVDYMKTALSDVQEDVEVVPDTIITQWINKDTGQLTDELDPQAIEEYFIHPDLLSTNTEIVDESQNVKQMLPNRHALDANESLDGENLLPPRQPQEKIIESETDTQGLF